MGLCSLSNREEEDKEQGRKLRLTFKKSSLSLSLTEEKKKRRKKSDIVENKMYFENVHGLRVYLMPSQLLYEGL